MGPLARKNGPTTSSSFSGTVGGSSSDHGFLTGGAGSGSPMGPAGSEEGITSMMANVRIKPYTRTSPDLFRPIFALDIAQPSFRAQFQSLLLEGKLRAKAKKFPLERP
jgi:hypothetical protein